MSSIIEKCNVLFKELHLFSEDVISLGHSISDDRLEIFEDKIGFKLPLDFKYIIKQHNGISLLGTEILGIDKSYRDASLEVVYMFEHSTSSNKMPTEFLPFSPDGRGNHYCLNLAKVKDGTSPVVFWQWDYDYENINDVEEANESLTAWIQEVMIDWKLEEYNYDGTEK